MVQAETTPTRIENVEVGEVEEGDVPPRMRIMVIEMEYPPSHLLASTMRKRLEEWGYDDSDAIVIPKAHSGNYFSTLSLDKAKEWFAGSLRNVKHLVDQQPKEFTFCAVLFSVTVSGDGTGKFPIAYRSGAVLLSVLYDRTTGFGGWTPQFLVPDYILDSRKTVRGFVYTPVNSEDLVEENTSPIVYKNMSLTYEAISEAFKETHTIPNGVPEPSVVQTFAALTSCIQDGLRDACGSMPIFSTAKM